MKNFFKPEDFNIDGVSAFNWQEKSAELANDKLKAEIEKWPVAWLDGETCTRWSEYVKKDASKKARLAFIEEIPKEPCKHEPYQTNANLVLTTYPPQYPEPEYKCKHCGVELVAEWKEKI